MSGSALKTRGGMRVRFVLGTVVTAVAIVMAHPGAGLAAVTNDDFDSATVIGSLPFSDTVDMSQATVAPDDPFVCGSTPAGTVWYEFTPTFSGLVRATTSTFLAEIDPYTGSRGSLSLHSCADAFAVTAGVTYHVMFYSGLPDVGSVTLSLERYLAPEVSLTVDPVGRVNSKTGAAILSGSFSCSSAIGASVGDDQAAGSLTQLFARRVRIQGFFEFAPSTVCTGETVPWTTTVVGGNGLFAAGKGHASAFLTACDTNGICSDVAVEKDVQLKSGGQ
jgi:hypothetical protein